MIKKLNPKHGGKSNGFLNNYFEQNCSDINKGKDFCIKQVIRNVKKNDISQFYDLVGESLTKDKRLEKIINGITISPKKSFCIIKIWLTNCLIQNSKKIVEIDYLDSDGVLFRKHNPEY